MGLVTWRIREGKGVHCCNGKTLGPGDLFRAHPHTVRNFRDKVERVDGKPDNGGTVAPRPARPMRVWRRGHGRYDAIHPVTGRPVNTAPLYREEAQALAGISKSRIFRVPRMWPDENVVVIGGGPSVAETDLSHLTDVRVIGVNNACFLGDFVDLAFFGDCNWYDWNAQRLLAEFHGPRITVCERHADKPGILYVPRGKPSGLELGRPDRLAWNRSSGACAVNLAFHLGARRVILAGFDMRFVDGRANYHDEHLEKQAGDPYPRFIRYFGFVARDAKKAGMEIVNATPGSAMEHFPVTTLEKALEGTENHG